jgi:glycosyltransferase involved in cell wall biosynthesis|tara:strand:- start:72009 stop:73058 length:1050 start_codon:yes stop_codon:yes gene_type:complete
MDILTAIYGPGRGGSERAALRLVAAWRDLGHRVTVLGEAGDGAARPLSLARQIVRHGHQGPPDILFAPGQTYALPFALAHVLARPGHRYAPPLVTKISNMPSPADRWALHWLSLQKRWTTKMVAPDRASQDELHRMIGGSVDRFAFVANPAAERGHLSHLHAIKPAAAGPLRLLAIGRLVPQKNFALLIEAFCKIATPADQLTVLGEGPERVRLERQANASGLDIRLPGFRADPAAELAAANAFASTSDFEGLPAVLIEALAVGLPIAATASSPAVTALLNDEQLGLLTPVNDVQAMAGALQRLRTFRPDRRAMYAAALHFTAEEAAPAYIRLFEGLADFRKTAKRALA